VAEPPAYSAALLTFRRAPRPGAGDQPPPRPRLLAVDLIAVREPGGFTVEHYSPR
jgi:hypothetical protein